MQETEDNPWRVFSCCTQHLCRAVHFFSFCVLPNPGQGYEDGLSGVAVPKASSLQCSGLCWTLARFWAVRIAPGGGGGGEGARTFRFKLNQEVIGSLAYRHLGPSHCGTGCGTHTDS